MCQSKFRTLFEAIGTSYGSALDNHFRIPDYQGYFLRGLDPSGKRDPDRPESERKVGSTQLDATGPHTHPVSVTGVNPPHSYKDWYVTQWGTPNNENDPTASGGQGYKMAEEKSKETVPPGVLTLKGTSDESSTHGADTRPMNRAVFWIIKVR